MANDKSIVTGGCMCGAIRFEASGEPVNANYCHCKSCRRQTSTPVVALIGYYADQVTFTKGRRKLYNSSPGVGRGFCADCGSPLTWEGDGGDGQLIEILVGSLDDPAAVSLQNHFNYAERIPWFDTADSLPRYAEYDDAPPCATEPAI